jgi:peptidoglycan/LPS O-acetylase OafA/YrhL
MSCSKQITPSLRGRENLLIPDLVKGAAILWVVIFHVFFDFTNLFCGRDDGFNGLVCKIFLHGSLGVDLFVILSGYLLSRSCAVKDTVYWGEFLKNRLWRILPLYWLAIFLVIALAIIRPNESYNINWPSIWFHFFGVHGLTPYIFDIQGVWWFITLILQLYIIFPFAYKILQKYNHNIIIIFSIILMISARYEEFANFNTNYSLFAFLPVFYM